MGNIQYGSNPTQSDYYYVRSTASSACNVVTAGTDETEHSDRILAKYVIGPIAGAYCPAIYTTGYKLAATLKLSCTRTS